MFPEWEGVAKGPINFHWQRGDRFPAIEELKLGNPYDFDPANCNMWAYIMDWSHLRKLDLGRDSPRHLFSALTCRVPNLKSLKFGILSPMTSQNASTPHSLSIHPWSSGFPVLSNFISFIIALHELSFHASSYCEFDISVATMLRHQANHLKRLEISCDDIDMKYWTVEKYVDLVAKTENLEYLGVRIKDGVLEGTWEGEERLWSSWEKFERANKSESVTNGFKSHKWVRKSPRRYQPCRRRRG
ncbi:hypothetical protein K458DRAFT_421605 [Lentithecium fluviatile CBS 122367]|uniref:F-box domain-containing protein n=1 Tax=Lentithecium fluviatile CBS 122367 TaxID=1168545 RepID=A0A6G1IQE6_9PLEO|nr:hypothetical protein K458DRAFT_421605 [Lentithecium fluviatile CBS 122367]